MNTRRDWVLERRCLDSDNNWEISLYAGRPELFWSEIVAQDVADERNKINYLNCEWRVAHDW